MRMSPLTRAVGGRVVAGRPDVGHQVGGDRDLDAGLAQRRQHLLDVGEEQPVRPDDQHALALEREAVGVEEVRGAVQRDHGLAGARPALDDEHARAAAPG